MLYYTYIRDLSPVCVCVRKEKDVKPYLYLIRLTHQCRAKDDLSKGEIGIHRYVKVNSILILMFVYIHIVVRRPLQCPGYQFLAETSIASSNLLSRASVRVAFSCALMPGCVNSRPRLIHFPLMNSSQFCERYWSPNPGDVSRRYQLFIANEYFREIRPSRC